MPPILFKDLLVEIRHTLGRYLSILFIVALGVAFFAGIKASAPDMTNSADAYMDKYNLQDIQVYSTIGINQSDLDALKEVHGVEDVQGQYTSDFLAKKDAKELVVKLITYQDDQKINKPRLVDGRMPENDGECLIQGPSATGKIMGSTFEVGDTIELYSGNSTPVDDSLKTTTFKVAGSAYSPNYLSYELGSSAIGSGQVNTFIYVPPDVLANDIYTEADVIVQGAKDLDTYSDAYFDLTTPVLERIESIADEQVAKDIQSFNDELDAKEQEVNDKLLDGQHELDEAKKKLDDARAQYDDGLRQYNEGVQTLADSKTQYENGLKEYEDGKKQLEDGLNQLNDGIAQIKAGEAQLEDLQDQRTQLTAALAVLPTLNTTSDTISTLYEQLNSLNERIDSLENLNPNSLLLPSLRESRNNLMNRINQAEMTTDDNRDEILAQIGGSEEAGRENLAKLDDAIEQIEEGIKQLPSLEEQRDQLLAKQQQLPEAKAQLEDAKKQIEDGEKKLEDSKAELEDGKKQLEDGQAEYDKGVKEFEKQSREAHSQLAKAREKIDVMGAKWIVLDRDSHYSYRDYQACAERMDGIAAVFPVFFFLVAALVCMTTMTRMVDEERNEMGTLKALGYSRMQISAKYMLYAGSASILGSILGCAVGMFVFPLIIYNSWGVMYNMEEIHFKFQPMLMLTASGLVTLIVLAATWFSISKEMREVPAQLMRPKAAKAGKRILLERVGWFWHRLSFMQKVTLRNLFRYKKRFFMTVIGISGCSALLLAGFGLNDSLSDIIPRQYEAISHYDAMVKAENYMNADEAAALAERLKDIEGVNQTISYQALPITVHYDRKDVAATLNIISDPEKYENFTTFHPESEDSLDHLTDDGALISVQTAERIGLGVGDELTFKTSEYEQEVKVKVTGIFEQYTGQEIFITQKLFDQLGIEDTPSATILLQNESVDPDFEADLGTSLMADDDVRSVTFYSSMQDNFIEMIATVKLVVVVLIICAAMLAFVVLYNLSNVNISERMREIATIKVLGFTEKEVNAYVNNETIILALIGSLVGLVLGIYLHGLIISMAELDTVRFGRTILWQSYAYSVGLTMLFTLIINFIMKYSLRHIQMVESLKAVE